MFPSKEVAWRPEFGCVGWGPMLAYLYQLKLMGWPMKLPGVTALLIVNLAFGVVSRAAPSLNLFAVGFPISLIIGLIVVLAGMGPLTQGIAQLIGQGLQFLRDLSGV